jgi:hypothetical protein
MAEFAPLIPAEAGIQTAHFSSRGIFWAPAFAGTSG